MKNYLELIKIRMGERLTFSVDADDGVLNQPLPPMLLQPIVENAIKHGLEPKVEGGQISIRASADSSTMRFEITDNGLGFQLAASNDADGVGLANLRERLSVLYDGLATHSISDARPGTRVVITIPKSTPTSQNT